MCPGFKVLSACYCDFRSSVMWHCVARQAVPDVSEDHGVFDLQQVQQGLLDPEYAGITFLQTIKNNSSSDTVSHPRRFEAKLQELLPVTIQCNPLLTFPDLRISIM
jgi:hypothetical protein